MPIMPENYKSLTDMAIETTQKDWEAKKIAVDTAIKQQDADKKQQYLAQMAQAFQANQAPDPIAIDRQETDLAEKSYLQSSQNELARMQKAYQIAASNGMTTEANMWRDNITATEKSMFEYQANAAKDKATKITKASNILLPVTDQATYQVALETIRDTVDEKLAQKMFQQLGPRYNAKTAQQIKAMAYSGINADKQVDDARADKETEIKDKSLKETVLNNAHTRQDKDARTQLAREGLGLRKEALESKTKTEEKKKQTMIKLLDGVETRFNVEERQIRSELSKIQVPERGLLSNITGVVPQSIVVANARLDAIQKRLDEARRLKAQQMQSIKDNYRAIGVELEDSKDTSSSFEELE